MRLLAALLCDPVFSPSLLKPVCKVSKIPSNTFFTYSITYGVSSMTDPIAYNVYIEDYLDPNLSWNPADVIGAIAGAVAVVHV